jgi:outer membrane receptor protein involved in Fe transport
MRRQILAAGTSLLVTAAASAQDAEPSNEPVPVPAASSNQSQDEAATPSADVITVLGSRIPRTQIEGPAPVTTITADDILRQGFQDVPALMRAVTQNAGETQTTQSFGANTFTPGAQQVDLRGLGPSRTLVLVNGRRVADFPMPYSGNSNVADISNIPIGLIGRVEVLSGAASSIYGSDAISGVVNFVLKDELDGSRIDFQIGTTERGGGTSFRVSGTTGFESGNFRTLLGAEYRTQEPIFGFEREIQDSTADNPTRSEPLAVRNFLRYDSGGYYVDPGQAVCAGLGSTNEGTTFYAPRDGFGFDVNNGYASTDGYFCGSNEAIGYGHIQSDREALNLFSASTLELDNGAELFLDAQIGLLDTRVFNGFKDWYYQEGENEEGLFYNPDNLDPIDTYWLDQLDGWYRLFTPEEVGGFDNAMITNESITLNITTGVRGTLGSENNWNYEAYYNHARYTSEMAWPEIVIDASNAFFLGAPVNDPGNTTGYTRFNADPARLFTALTPAEYAQISANTVYKPETYVHNFQGTLTMGDLFELPAGPVGFAAVVEAGTQGYDVNPDPLALTNYYVGIRDSDGSGDREHFGSGVEFRVPIFEALSLSAAGRYDHYSYAQNDFGEATYNLGLEYRPVDQLLIRGAIGTGFRAPDLHYVYRGPGTVNGSGADYFDCRTTESNPTAADCVNNYFEGFINERAGNPELLPETAQSITAGFVWAPMDNFDLSVDYFRIDMDEQVANLSVDQLLRDEAACRIGTFFDGSAVDTGSPTCVDALNRVNRFASGASTGEIRLINLLPINIAQQETDGIDVEANASFNVGDLGDLSFGASYTYVLDNTIQQYPEDRVIDKFEPISGYEIPRDKGRAYVTWSTDRFSTTLTTLYTGEMTNWNWDDKIDDSWWFYLSGQYYLTDRVRISATVDNLLDSDPVEDPSHASYPYYNSSWYNSIGRSYYLQLTYKFGGDPL